MGDRWHLLHLHAMELHLGYMPTNQSAGLASFSAGNATPRRLKGYVMIMQKFRSCPVILINEN